MKKIVKYGCYALLSVAVFIAFWIMGGFISLEYNLNEWEGISRFTLLAMSITVTGMIIAIVEINESYR